MRFEIVFAPEAVEDLDLLPANARAEVIDAIERHLRFDPRKTSKSRIKRLRGMSRPQFRLRVGDNVRVLYDVAEGTVEILAAISKEKLNEWIKKHGESDEGSTV